MKDAEQRLMTSIQPVLEETDPTAAIHKALELPFTLEESDYSFRKLQYKLQWEGDDHQ